MYALSHVICIRLSVRVCVCVCNHLAIESKSKDNKFQMCAHASMSVCEEWHIEHMPEQRSPVAVSSLWTMAELEGDRLHKFAPFTVILR